jgi:DNA-binding transcriptional ArsR family regulator
MQAVLRAITEPRRREILRLVSERELAAAQIHEAIGDVTFGAISQHLRVLAEARLVQVRREGRHRLYQARVESLEPLRAWLDTMWSRSLVRLTELAEDEERSSNRLHKRQRRPR